MSEENDSLLAAPAVPGQQILLPAMHVNPVPQRPPMHAPAGWVLSGHTAKNQGPSRGYFLRDMVKGALCKNKQKHRDATC